MVDFDDVFDLPFFLDRSEGSVIRQYIAAHNDEIQDFGDKLEEVMESHQIDNATGEELDQIGAAFGPLGRRRSRGDQEYRIYIKSLVQSFRGRGTVPGIISAVAAGLNTEDNNVEIIEDFQDLEYTIRLTDWSSHRGTTIEELAELADASVSRLKRIEYDVVTEEMTVSDSVKAIVSTRVEDEEISIDDAPFVDQNLTTTGDDMGAADTAAVDSNKVTEAEDMGVADTAAANRRGVTEGYGANDAVAKTETTVAWDVGNWDSMNWAKDR